MSATRSVSLFRNGRNQAVRIPREFELEGTQALMRKEGDSLVITPLSKLSLWLALQDLEPLDEEFPEIEDFPPEPLDPL